MRPSTSLEPSCLSVAKIKTHVLRRSSKFSAFTFEEFCRSSFEHGLEADGQAHDGPSFIASCASQVQVRTLLVSSMVSEVRKESDAALSAARHSERATQAVPTEASGAIEAIDDAGGVQHAWQAAYESLMPLWSVQPVDSCAFVSIPLDFLPVTTEPSRGNARGAPAREPVGPAADGPTDAQECSAFSVDPAPTHTYCVWWDLWPAADVFLSDIDGRTDPTHQVSLPEPQAAQPRAETHLEPPAGIELEAQSQPPGATLTLSKGPHPRAALDGPSDDSDFETPIVRRGQKRVVLDDSEDSDEHDDGAGKVADKAAELASNPTDNDMRMRSTVVQPRRRREGLLLTMPSQPRASTAATRGQLPSKAFKRKTDHEQNLLTSGSAKQKRACTLSASGFAARAGALLLPGTAVAMRLVGRGGSHTPAATSRPAARAGCSSRYAPPPRPSQGTWRMCERGLASSSAPSPSTWTCSNSGTREPGQAGNIRCAAPRQAPALS